MTICQIMTQNNINIIQECECMVFSKGVKLCMFYTVVSATTTKLEAALNTYEL